MRIGAIELASDFMSAGLLDRAGRLLLKQCIQHRGKANFKPKILDFTRGSL